MESPEPNRRWLRVAVRAIRGVVSIACLLACIGFAALWVRSYYSSDSLYRLRSSKYLGASSWDGQITYLVAQLPLNFFLLDYPLEQKLRELERV
jgi:hypothetical protein